MFEKILDSTTPNPTWAKICNKYPLQSQLLRDLLPSLGSSFIILNSMSLICSSNQPIPTIQQAKWKPSFLFVMMVKWSKISSHGWWEVHVKRMIHIWESEGPQWKLAGLHVILDPGAIGKLTMCPCHLIPIIFIESWGGWVWQTNQLTQKQHFDIRPAASQGTHPSPSFKWLHPPTPRLWRNQMSGPNNPCNVFSVFYRELTTIGNRCNGPFVTQNSPVRIGRILAQHHDPTHSIHFWTKNFMRGRLQAHIVSCS